MLEEITNEVRDCNSLVTLRKVEIIIDDVMKCIENFVDEWLRDAKSTRLKRVIKSMIINAKNKIVLSIKRKSCIVLNVDLFLYVQQDDDFLSNRILNVVFQQTIAKDFLHLNQCNNEQCIQFIFVEKLLDIVIEID